MHGVEYTATRRRPRTRHTPRYVIDASGNTSRLHSQVGGARVYSDFFRNLAVFGYFAGGARLPEPNRGNIFCAAFDAGWLWYIPLRDDLTSVGAVIAPDARANGPAGSGAAAWQDMIEACPEVSDMLAGVPTATEPPYDEVRVRKDYSYWKKSFWRPGMALVGDAACFVDPVLSSGVHLATYGALLAARSVNASLAGNVPEERGFAEFEARYRREYRVFYEFLIAFYDMEQQRPVVLLAGEEGDQQWTPRRRPRSPSWSAAWCRATRRWRSSAGRGSGAGRRGGTPGDHGQPSQPTADVPRGGRDLPHRQRPQGTGPVRRPTGHPDCLKWTIRNRGRPVVDHRMTGS